jgi:hypothetical protein
MACSVAAAEKTTKQTMSRVVKALCEDALKVLSRHPKLACFRAELLLKLAWYTAEVEDTHVRCQWGLGEGCYGGNFSSEKRRWEVHSATQLSFLELKNKQGDDVVRLHTLDRCQRWTKFMHNAVSSGALDPVTRADVALRCASLCLRGLRVSEWNSIDFDILPRPRDSAVSSSSHHSRSQRINRPPVKDQQIVLNFKERLHFLR